MRPLEGIRVLDLTQSVAGPERPGGGDDTRSWGPPYWGDESTMFLAGRLRTDTTEAWTGKLWGAEVPCSPIRTVDQVVAEPRTEAVGILRSTDHPRLGDTTREILDELGRSPQEISDLVAEGVVLHSPCERGEGKSVR